MSCGEYIVDNAPDNYNSHWERCIKVGLYNLEEVENIYKCGLVTDDEYYFAVEYLTEVY